MFTSLRWSVWGQQYCAVAGAMSALMAMIIILWNFDGKPIFSVMGVTLNAIISIISVTMKAAITFVLSECLAQWKWILFSREPRLMIDFDRFDGATRGPLGSLRILFKTRGALIAQLGAILTLIAVGLDPFAQQILQVRDSFEYGDGPDGTSALISRTKNYSLGTAEPIVFALYETSNETSGIQYVKKWWPITYEITPSMGVAILSGFSRSLEEVKRETLFQCPTGNCTFNSFETLGICHKCNNLTSSLEQIRQNFNSVLKGYQPFPTDIPKSTTGHRLPNGHFIANSDQGRPYSSSSQGFTAPYTVTSFGTGNPSKTVSMKDINTLLWSQSLIYLDLEALGELAIPIQSSDPRPNWSEVSLQAAECSLYYCVKNITSTVKNNQLEEEITEVTGITRAEKSWNYGLTDDDGRPPEFHAPASEAPNLEFNERWSAANYSSLWLVDSKGDIRATVAQQSIKSLSAHFQQLFRWNATAANETGFHKNLNKINGMKDAVGFNGASFGPDKIFKRVDDRLKADPPILGRLVSTTRSDFAGIASVFETIATSMTNDMRRTSSEADLASNGRDTMSHKGRVQNTVVLYQVKWEWISLHVAMLVLASVFLLLTINGGKDNAGIPLWKSSSLAALRHGHEVGSLLLGAGTAVRDMEATARAVYMGERENDVEEPNSTMKQSYHAVVETVDESVDEPMEQSAVHPRTQSYTF